jgi:predicted Zn-dependent protease
MLLVSAAVGCGGDARESARGVQKDTQPERAELLTPAQFESAANTYQALYHRPPDRTDVMSIAAELAVRKGDDVLASRLFARIPSAHQKYGHSARYQQGQVLLRLDHAVEAERQLREFLRLEEADPQMKPEHRTDARQRLRYILEIELRFKERHQLLAGMVDRGEADPIDTQLFLFPNLLRWNGAAAVSQCERFFANDPGDPNLRAALGRYRVGQGRLDEAAAMLKALRTDQPKYRLAAAALMFCRMEQDDWTTMEREAADLPAPTDADPWLLSLMRGRLAAHRHEYADAAKHFERLLREDPANAEACAGLAEACGELGMSERRSELLARIRGLARIRSLLGEVQERPDEPDPLREIASACDEIGLPDHARLMRSLADQLEAALPTGGR